MLIYFVQKSNISKELLLRNGLIKIEEKNNEFEECKSEHLKDDGQSNFSRKSSYLNETAITIDSKVNEIFFIDNKSKEDVPYKETLNNDKDSINKINGKIYSFDNIYFKDLFKENPYFNSEYNQDLIKSLVNVI